MEYYNEIATSSLYIEHNFLDESCNAVYAKGIRINGPYYLINGHHYCVLDGSICGAGVWTLAMKSKGNSVSACAMLVCCSTDVHKSSTYKLSKHVDAESQDLHPGCVPFCPIHGDHISNYIFTLCSIYKNIYFLKINESISPSKEVGGLGGIREGMLGVKSAKVATGSEAILFLQNTPFRLA